MNFESYFEIYDTHRLSTELMISNESDDTITTTPSLLSSPSLYSSSSSSIMIDQSTEQIPKSYSKPIVVVDKIVSTSDCVHHNILYYQNRPTCADCGQELLGSSHNATPSFNDPDRCFIRRNKDRSIYSDVQHMNISQHVKDLANKIYKDVCGIKVHRGAYRRAIVFASVFHAYKLTENPQSCESLIQIFNIQRKDALKGLKFINEHAPVGAALRTRYITPAHLIREFMIKFDATNEQIADVIQLYESIKGKSSILNRSRPQSTASGVIFFYKKLTGRPIGMKEFVQKVQLSELTVNKISREVSRIYEIDHPQNQ